MSRTIVILRPEPAATRTARLVEESGLAAVKLALFKVQPEKWNAPDPMEYGGLLLTSTNGLRFAGPQAEKLKSLPVYAVGRVTAGYAEKLGFTVAAIGQSGVDGLLKHIPPGIRLLHLAGRNRMESKSTESTIDPITVYRSALLEDVDPAPIANNVTLVHSPRAGHRLAELAGDLKSSVRVVAISEQAAQACGEGWETIVSVGQPDERAMVALAAQLCDKPSKG